MKPIKKDYSDLKRLRRFKRVTQIIFLLFFLFPITYNLSPITYSFAAIPKLINYQGKLTDSSGTPITGSRNVTFKIYEQESGGSPIWTETQNLTLTKGIFSVLLGGVTALNIPFDKAYWLGIQVEGDPEMAPRLPFTSSGYALRANVANETVSLPRGIITMWSGSVASIPSGWALCDGTNGTPDLRNRFIVGASVDFEGIAKTAVKGSLMQTGGEHEHTLTIAEMPSHNHEYKIGAYSSATSSGVERAHWQHDQTLITENRGSDQPHENCPPFYALAYIMKL